MNRRGFLESIMAVTAVIGSGVKLPAGREVARATPKALATQNELLDLLEHCHATSIEGHATIKDGMRYVVEYVHHEKAKPNDIDRQIAGYTKSMRPVDVRYSMRAGELMHITVEWA
jgi:hypothetical protein